MGGEIIGMDELRSSWRRGCDGNSEFAGEIREIAETGEEGR